MKKTGGEEEFESVRDSSELYVFASSQMTIGDVLDKTQYDAYKLQNNGRKSVTMHKV